MSERHSITDVQCDFDHSKGMLGITLAMHGKAWQSIVISCHKLFEMDRQTEGQVQFLSCAFAVKNENFQTNKKCTLGLGVILT